MLLQVLVTYGKWVLQAPSGGDPYGDKYKGIWNCLTILTRALAGNYVNFGVFDLYGDPALKVLAATVLLGDSCIPPLPIGCLSRKLSLFTGKEGQALPIICNVFSQWL